MAKETVKSNQSVKDEQKAKRTERRDAAKKAADKKSRQHKLIFIGIIAVLVLFAALIIVYNITTNGSEERNTIVASTENYEVSRAMLTYYFNSLYNQYANSYSQYGTDSFNELVESVNSRGTYYEVLLSSAKSSVENYLTLAEMAKRDGVKLEKAEKEAIDQTIQDYKDLKVSYGQSNNAYQIMDFDKFLETMFGEGVNESVVRDCLELVQIANKYETEYLEKLEYTDEELEAYYEENKDAYLLVDYLKATFTEPAEETADTDTDTDTEADAEADTEPDEDAEAGEEGEGEDAEAGDEDEEVPGEDDEENEDAENDEENNDENAEDGENAEDSETEPEEEQPASETKLTAEALAATKSAEEFNAFMTDYYTKEAEATLEEGKELDTDAIKTKVENLNNTKKVKGNLTGDDVKEWAYAEDTKAGDTKLVYDESSKTYTVYMLTKTAYRDEEITKKAAILYLTDANYDGNSETKANEIKAEWDAGEKTEAAFIALCEKYSESTHNHVDEGYTSDTSYIGEWLFEEGRAVGDVEVFHVEATSASYLVYYGGDGSESWKVDARSAKKSEDFDAAVKAFLEANPVTYDEAAMKKVKVISLSTQSSSN